LKLPDDVRNPRRYQTPFDQHKRRPDIWFYTRENIKDIKEERKELVLNLVEITIP
jgi:hypothetical protein